MSKSQFTRWICNVCQGTEETATDRQPTRWAGYGFTETGVPGGNYLEVGHLCGECLVNVYDAMAKKDHTPAAEETA